jgi:Arc/MetJ-type ribon-helix-helix transcriptional regulator
MGRPQIERHKIKTSITIDPELYTWVQSKIETKEFSNLTHAIERGLILLREIPMCGKQ